MVFYPLLSDPYTKDVEKNVLIFSMAKHFASCNSHNYWRKYDKIYRHIKEQKIKNRRDNIALRSHPYTQVIALDLDTHTTHISEKRKGLKLCIQSLKLISKKLEMNPAFVEISRLGRGAHAYWFVDNHKNIPLIQDMIKDECKIDGVTIEWRTTKKALRLPFSYDYCSINISGLRIKRLISSQVIEKLEGIEESIKDGEKYYLIDTKRILDINGKEIRTGEVPYLKRNSVLPSVEWEGKLITRGNRVGGEGLWVKLGFYGARYGWSPDEFADKSIEYNESSYDLTHWDREKLVDECEKLLIYFHKKLKEYRVKRDEEDPYVPDEFRSSLDYITPKIAKQLKQIIDERVCAKTLYQKKVKRDVESLLPEIVGKFLYEKENPRKTKYSIDPTLSMNLVVGSQFPIIWKQMVRDYYYLTTDMRKLFKICFSLLQIKQYYSNKHGWSWTGKYRYCKQFVLPTRLGSLLVLLLRKQKLPDLVLDSRGLVDEKNNYYMVHLDSENREIEKKENDIMINDRGDPGNKLKNEVDEWIESRDEEIRKRILKIAGLNSFGYP